MLRENRIFIYFYSKPFFSRMREATADLITESERATIELYVSIVLNK